MSGGPLVWRELRPQRVALTAGDAEYLRQRYRAHLDVRPLPGDPGAWLVTPGQVCGVIPLPSGRSAHIEPKAPLSTVWHLLAGAWGIAPLGPPTTVRGVAGLLEGWMAAYVRELAALVDRGLARGFVTRHEVLPVLRGRLELPVQLRGGAAAVGRFACAYEDLGLDTPANRVLRAALELARVSCACDPGLAPAVHRCLAALAPVPAGPMGRLELARVCAPAAAGHYRTALALARLILEGCAADHRRGARPAPALLVEMPRLFERFVYDVLARGLPPGLRARSGAPATALDHDGRALLAPDVVVEAARMPVCVVDAKYKISADPRAARASEPRAEDVYQMLAYCVGCGVREAVLIYPEPRVAPPLVIDLLRPRRAYPSAERARVHVLGMDLSGDRPSVRAQCNELCARVAAIAARDERAVR